MYAVNRGRTSTNCVCLRPRYVLKKWMRNPLRAIPIFETTQPLTDMLRLPTAPTTPRKKAPMPNAEFALNVEK